LAILSSSSQAGDTEVVSISTRESPDAEDLNEDIDLIILKRRGSFAWHIVDRSADFSMLSGVIPYSSSIRRSVGK
jgi:hypothetical protein